MKYPPNYVYFKRRQKQSPNLNLLFLKEITQAQVQTLILETCILGLDLGGHFVT